MASGPSKNDEADLSFERGDESAENREGFAVHVPEGNRREEFKILSSQIDFEDNQRFFHPFKKQLELWPFEMKLVVMCLGETGVRPYLYTSLKPKDEKHMELKPILKPKVEEDVELKPRLKSKVKKDVELSLNDIPLVYFQQLTLRDVLFYKFREIVNGKLKLPKDVRLICREEITMTISTIPYIESTNGAFELTINLNEFENREELRYRYFNPRGKNYYIFTSPEGYLVKIGVFYVNRNFYADVSFMAGPNDENLSYHFPHVFYAIVKHKTTVEKNVYATPVFRYFKKSEAGMYCDYEYPISTLDVMTCRNVITANKLVVKFCIVPVR